MGKALCQVRVWKGFYCETHVSNELNSCMGQWDPALCKQSPWLFRKNGVDGRSRNGDRVGEISGRGSGLGSA